MYFSDFSQVSQWRFFFFFFGHQEWYRTLAEHRREIQQEMDLDEEKKSRVMDKLFR